MWDRILEFFSELNDHQWLKDYFLYLAILGGIIIMILLCIWVYKFHKESKEMKKKSLKKNRNLIKILGRRNTSK